MKKEEYKKSINHFSIPLTKKYTAYSCIVLPPDRFERFAMLVIKVKNQEDNSDHGLCEVLTFSQQNLNKDLSIINCELDICKNYLTSRKFTDDEIEKNIEEVQKRIQLSHEKLIEDSKREFQEIFASSYLLNTPTEQILKDLDNK